MNSRLTSLSAAVLAASAGLVLAACSATVPSAVPAAAPAAEAPAAAPVAKVELPASGWTDTATLAQAMPQYRYVLLGEQHDNAEGHRLRHEALEQAVAQGWRPVIAMEQFDQEQAEDLRRAQAECGQDADCVIQRAAPAKSGWQWEFYRPVVALALRYDLPLVPANLSRAEAGKVLRQGVPAVFTPEEQHALRLDGDVPPRLLPLHNEIFSSLHGGHATAEQVAPFSRAQMARDAVMAQSLRRADDRPAVLIAGNGHVRADVGVAQWLDAAEGGVLAVGFVTDLNEPGQYDARIRIPAVPRGQ
ncbi:ChaN family lipoprotein [Kerstersia sp.]|uniref:ChaN family lipoprotein n=1 Tax=Kerstersia sp. TaxID=1930783 RepID=UPI003F93986D